MPTKTKTKTTTKKHVKKRVKKPDPLMLSLAISNCHVAMAGVLSAVIRAYGNSGYLTGDLSKTDKINEVSSDVDRVEAVLVSLEYYEDHCLDELVDHWPRVASLLSHHYHFGNRTYDEFVLCRAVEAASNAVGALVFLHGDRWTKRWNKSCHEAIEQACAERESGIRYVTELED